MTNRLIVRRAIRWGIPIVVVLLVAVYGFISFTITSGIIKYERKPQEDHPTAYDLKFEYVGFPSRGGDVNLSGWYIFGEDQGPTLILVHGIGGVRSADNLVDFASRMAAQGFNVLMFDLRCHGDSGGEHISAGYFERFDVLGAFDFLIGHGITEDRIGILGVSMGAATSMLAAAEEPAIRALVVDSPYAKVSELIAQETARKMNFPEWITPIFLPGVNLTAKVLYGINISALSPEEIVKLLPYPIMVIHGKADTRIPFDHGVRVHEAAHLESIIWLIPNVDHVDAFLTYPEEYVDRVVDYFDGQLSID